MYKQFSYIFLQSFFLLHFCGSIQSQAEKKVILSAPVGQIPASSQLVPLCWGSCGLNQGWQKQQPPLPVSEQKMNGCGTRWKAMLNLMELVYGESSTQKNFICLPATNEIHLFCTSWQIEMCQNIRVMKVGGLHWQLCFFVAHWFKSEDFKQISYWSLGQSWTNFHEESCGVWTDLYGWSVAGSKAINVWMSLDVIWETEKAIKYLERHLRNKNQNRYKIKALGIQWYKGRRLKKGQKGIFEGKAAVEWDITV